MMPLWLLLLLGIYFLLMRDDNLEIFRFKDDHVFYLVHFHRK